MRVPVDNTVLGDYQGRALVGGTGGLTLGKDLLCSVNVDNSTIFSRNI